MIIQEILQIINLIIIQLQNLKKIKKKKLYLINIFIKKLNNKNTIPKKNKNP